jgi:hypothetical protein
MEGMIMNKILIKLDHIEFFQRVQYQNGLELEIPGIFWTDKHQIQPVGPFVNLFQAGEHYTIAAWQRYQQQQALLNTSMSAANKPLKDPTVPEIDTKVIQVDFKARKRVK